MIAYFILILQLFDTSPVARIHYGGGGDWYGNKTSFRNIFRLYEKKFKVKLPLQEEVVKLTEKKLLNYPILYISGHGNVKFNDEDVKQLRYYLLNGGFLFIDDDYGIDTAIRREMKKVFPNSEFLELPIHHDIFKYPFSFPKGLPKIHEHAGGAPKAFALFYQKRMIAFYSFNTDISDGCEDIDIHGHSEELHLIALEMAINILHYGLNN